MNVGTLISFHRFHLHDAPQQRKGWGGEQNFTILFIFCLQMLANRQRAAPTRKHLTPHKSVIEITVREEKKWKFVEPKGSSLVCFDDLSHAVAVVFFSWFLLSERKTNPDISNKHQRGCGNWNRHHTVGTKWKTMISSGHNFRTVPLHFRI